MPAFNAIFNAMLIGMEFKGVDEGERVPIGGEPGLALQHDDFETVRTVAARYRHTRRRAPGLF